MKKIHIIILTTLFFIALPQKVFAHILKYDGSIGAVIHVEPEDDPIAGENTNLFFEFKDKEKKFNPADCDCRIIVNQNGTEIYSGDILAGNNNPTLTNIGFKYIFPTIGIFNIVVNGNPKTSESFQNFSLSYDIRVARESKETVVVVNDNFFSKNIKFVLGGVALIVLIVYIRSKIGRK